MLDNITLMKYFTAQGNYYGWIVVAVILGVALTLYFTVFSGNSSTQIGGSNHLTNKGTYLALFYSPDCPHCVNFKPIWKELEQETLPNNIKMVKIDATKETKLSDEYDITGYPTILLIKNGKTVKEFDDVRTVENLLDFVSS